MQECSPSFMLYSSVSDRGVVCVLLHVCSGIYRKVWFPEVFFSWYRVRTVCKSGFWSAHFENPLSRDEMFKTTLQQMLTASLADQ